MLDFALWGLLFLLGASAFVPITLVLAAGWAWPWILLSLLVFPCAFVIWLMLAAMISGNR